jgi:intraflagellar transport protein 172
MAMVTTDRVVSIFDEKGERVDKFATKPNDKGPKNYIVRSLAFCPDPAQAKLAVAQSDNIVFIYKWAAASPSGDGTGDIWSGKKSICNKFAGSSPVTSLVWAPNHPFEVVYGLAEGKVKIGQLRSNRHQTLYNAEVYVVALAADPHGTGIVSAHLDGSIYRYNFPESNMPGPAYTKIAEHAVVRSTPTRTAPTTTTTTPLTLRALPPLRSHAGPLRAVVGPLGVRRRQRRPRHVLRPRRRPGAHL